MKTTLVIDYSDGGGDECCLLVIGKDGNWSADINGDERQEMLLHARKAVSYTRCWCIPVFKWFRRGY